MPFCVIAAEKESADLIRQDLIKTGFFPDWEFHISTSAQELYRYSPSRPDVVVVSRFLPGEETKALLQRLSSLFAASHIVLLAGILDEKGKAFVRMAKQAGLNNIVTGKLPGDRPYNILAALKYERQDDGLAALVEAEGDEAAVDMVAGTGADPGAPEVPAAPSPPRVTASRSPVYHPPVYPVRQHVSGPVWEGEKRAGEGDYLDELLGRYGPASEPAEIHPPLRAPEPPPARAARRDDAHAGVRPGKKGVLVLTAANKGGSGKSTVAITLSVALARSGIPVVLWDLDFGGPDVAEFFDLLGKVRGIEALIPGSFRPEMVQGLLAQVEGEDNLWILPGPTDHTIPCFEP
ncbi:MAG: P-loop NTPase, partial [Desulfotomaculales bacterium]